MTRADAQIEIKWLRSSLIFDLLWSIMSISSDSYQFFSIWRKAQVRVVMWPTSVGLILFFMYCCDNTFLYFSSGQIHFFLSID